MRKEQPRKTAPFKPPKQAGPGSSARAGLAIERDVAVRIGRFEQLRAIARSLIY